MTAQLERGLATGRALTNLLLEFAILAILALPVPSIAAAVPLVRRSRVAGPTG